MGRSEGKIATGRFCTVEVASCHRGEQLVFPRKRHGTLTILGFLVSTVQDIPIFKDRADLPLSQ